MSSKSGTPSTKAAVPHSTPQDRKVEQASPATEFAWHVHQLQIDWVSRVDSKAWILITLVSANLVLLFNLSTPGRTLDAMSGPRLAFFYLAVGLLICADLGATLVVMPFLNRRSLRKAESGGPPGLIYFGDLRSLDGAGLSSLLEDLSDHGRLTSIAHQSVALARIAWTKHVLLQWSIGLWLAGAAASLLLTLW